MSLELKGWPAFLLIITAEGSIEEAMHQAELAEHSKHTHIQLQAKCRCYALPPHILFMTSCIFF